MRKLLLAIGLVLLGASAGFLGAILISQPRIPPAAALEGFTFPDRGGDEELAHLLVRLELRTRAVIGDHYNRPQSPVPGIDFVYKRWLAKNAILPAAVADRVFSQVVPGITGGRAWVKMVVPEPRNPNNQGDSVALEMLRELQAGTPASERSTPEAYYFGEPIQAKKSCLPCHGEPRGEPDPVFARFRKEGWKDGQIIGAVIARVSPRK